MIRFVFILSWIVTAFSGSAGAADEPALVYEPTRYDFGEIYSGEMVQSEIVFRNEGTGALVVKAINFSCGCAIPKITLSSGREVIPAMKEITEIKPCIDMEKGPVSHAEPPADDTVIFKLEPGEWARVELHFKSLRRSGNVNHFMDVYTNDPENYLVHVPIRAHIKHAFIVDPPRADFGLVEKESRKSIVLKVKADDGRKFEILGIEDLPPFLSYKAEKVEEESGWANLLTLTYEGDAPVRWHTLNLKVQVDHEKVSEFVLFTELRIAPPILFMLNDERIYDTINLGRLERGRDSTVEIDVINADLRTPYHIKEIVCRSVFDPPAETSFQEVEPGIRYKVFLKIPSEVKDRFVKGKLTIVSDSPDLPLAEFKLRGFF